MNKTLDQHFFSFLPLKTGKMDISTSVWSGQHPNAGQNITQLKSWKGVTMLANPYQQSNDVFCPNILQSQLETVPRHLKDI